MSPRKWPYWTTIGSSRWSSARSSATCSAVALGPRAMRAGSPGMTRAMAKTSTETPNGTMPETPTRLARMRRAGDIASCAADRSGRRPNRRRGSAAPADRPTALPADRVPHSPGPGVPPVRAGGTSAARGSPPPRLCSPRARGGNLAPRLPDPPPLGPRGENAAGARAVKPAVGEAARCLLVDGPARMRARTPRHRRRRPDPRPPRAPMPRCRRGAVEVRGLRLVEPALSRAAGCPAAAVGALAGTGRGCRRRGLLPRWRRPPSRPSARSRSRAGLPGRSVAADALDDKASAQSNEVPIGVRRLADADGRPLRC